MENAEAYVKSMLEKHRIKIDLRAKIEELSVSNKINEFMPLETVYNVVLLNLAKESEMYKSILNGTYVFDIEVDVRDERRVYNADKLRKKVEDIFGERARYVYVCILDKKTHFVGIRLGDNAYTPVDLYDGPEEAIPYFLLANGLKMDFSVSDFRWNEIVFENPVAEDEHAKYVEITEHVKKIRIPVAIIDEEVGCLEESVTNMHICYLHCGSHENWPESSDALRCAKTALYCLIYKKSKYRCAIGYDYVLLKYRGSFFKFHIVIKKDKNTEFRINRRIADAVNEQTCVFKKNVVSLKRFLDSHGYFPVYFDDRLVELMCLMIGKEIMSFGRFFNEFLAYKIKLDGCTFDLETFKTKENMSKRFEVIYKNDMLSIGIPPEKVVKRLNALKKIIALNKPMLFDDDFRLVTKSLLMPSFNDYDFVLSFFTRPEFCEIKGAEKTPFVLGTPVISEFLHASLKKKAYLFYSQRHLVLMVKAIDGVDPLELLCVLVMKTGFKYCLKRF
ncbi:hypothetical protein CWI42_060960 [Ordospora colligata]|uniref:Uncharacterized protein n=1 Tax=Ordospora colligata OC4 TaxID=1354746 RepID=A0A0B2UKR5_9MICR|nr:uncharacterized protein M896_060960 [Ordospora colligata OC4]KHN69595.1 hypothetical protein M896_060960 [Ordospora colligata OC4]TBU18611.1 hypothetical protein CWI42_060960 [Ordospora colligata]